MTAPGGRWLGRLAVLLALAAAAPLAAQPAAEAEALYQRGVRLYHERSLEEALEAMLASNRLVSNANVCFNIAQIYALLDRPTQAFNWYQRYLSFVKSQDERQRGEARLAELADKVAVVEVATSQTAVRLFLDRVELGPVGEAPIKLAVAPGSRRIIGQKPGFTELGLAFDAVVGTTTSLTMELERMVGVLSLLSQPAGAQVFVDDGARPIGVTPLEKQLPVGKLRLRLKLHGYLPAQLDVVVGESQAVKHLVELEPDAAQLAQLHVRSTPEGASLSLDGDKGGSIPLSLDNLEPGTYSLRVTHPGHVDWTKSMQLAAGLSTDVNVQLTPTVSRPWAGWPYLGYIGGSTLLVTGATIGIKAVVDRKNGSEDVQLQNNLADALMVAGLVTLAVTWIFTSLLAEEQTPSTAKVSAKRAQQQLDALR